MRLSGRLEGYGVVRFDHSSPSQAPQARLDVAAEQKVVPKWRWRISWIGLAGGPPKNPDVGFFDLSHTFQNFSPSLELNEAYIDHAGDDFAVRLGKQKFSWGRLDAVQPNDLLNPRQYQDPFLTDERDLKIAVPALSATWYLPAAWRDRLPDESQITVAWVPFAVPWRFPLERERWFAPAARARSTVEVPCIRNLCPGTVAVEQQTKNTPPPARQLDNGNLGVRLSGRLSDTDFALVYFDGYDPAPNFTVPVRIASPVNDGATPVSVEADLLPAYRRFRSIGADAARPLGRFTLRTEAAWRFRRPYPFAVEEVTSQISADERKIWQIVEGETVEVPAFVERDAVEWGIGADTAFGSFMPLLELNQTILLHNDQRLLIPNVDTRITANLRHRWLSDRLEGQLLGIWGIEAGYELLRAQASYDILDGLQVVGGVLGIWGDRNTLIGQYNRNSEAYAKMRYTF